jgi:hypothetical protein
MAGQKKPASPASGAVKWLVPPAVEQKFVIENPEASAEWKKDGRLYRAQFIHPLNNAGYIIVYDSTGRVVVREKELENTDYPAPINDFFIKNYPGEGYVVWSSTDSTGNVYYYSTRNSETLRFDKQGNYQSPAKLRLKPGDTLTPVIVR